MLQLNYIELHKKYEIKATNTFLVGSIVGRVVERLNKLVIVRQCVKLIILGGLYFIYLFLHPPPSPQMVYFLRVLP